MNNEQVLKELDKIIILLLELHAQLEEQEIADELMVEELSKRDSE